MFKASSEDHASIATDPKRLQPTRNALAHALVFCCATHLGLQLSFTELSSFFDKIVTVKCSDPDCINPAITLNRADDQPVCEEHFIGVILL